MSIKEVYDWYAKEGYLTAVPNGNLTLYKYTQRTVFEANWNYHTKTARGLILDKDGNIVARPWAKFFNLNERPEVNITVLPKDELPELAEKYDGSLIVVFWNPDTLKWDAVTCGSWMSEQAVYARAWLDAHWQKLEDTNRTYLFELIAPWNRIVVKYPKAQMVYLGSVENLSGADESYEQARNYALTHDLEPLSYFKSPLEAINLEDKEVVNAEGYVARFPSGLRVKMKYSIYLELHKILTGCSVKGIWEAMSEGRERQFMDYVPDEFKDWYNEEKCKLHDNYRKIEQDALRAFEGRPRYNEAEWAAKPTALRKETAEYLKQYKGLEGILFYMLDGFDYRPLIWKRIKPNGHRVFKLDQVS